MTAFSIRMKAMKLLMSDMCSVVHAAHDVSAYASCLRRSPVQGQMLVSSADEWQSRLRRS